jgi:hypothetical protein
MYKAFRIKKKYRLTINTFKQSAKVVSVVYHSGIRNWETQDDFNYSIVIKTFRIIFSIQKKQMGYCS